MVLINACRGIAHFVVDRGSVGSGARMFRTAEDVRKAIFVSRDSHDVPSEPGDEGDRTIGEYRRGQVRKTPTMLSWIE